MGRILDGVSPHMSEYKSERTFEVAGAREAVRAGAYAEYRRGFLEEFGRGR